MAESEREDGPAGDADWLARIPKVELHLHLEGAIPLDALWALVGKYGGEPGLRSVADLEARFRYRDFPHFIETWVWKNGFLREEEDFTFIAAAVARDLAAQNVRYAEVFFSPGDFARHGLEPAPIAAAIRLGLDEAGGPEVALVADLIRDFGPERGAATLAALGEAREFGIVGIGIGGSEHEFPPEPFAPVYERARALGLRSSAHAGEAAGPASVWGAIRALKVDRIGHGTRAGEDPALVDHIAEAGIPVELCPISNLRTGVVSSLAEHPARAYLERGIPISINTDDPKMFGNTLADEYRALMEQQGFTRAEIEGLILGAAAQSWLPDERKVALRRDLAESFAAAAAG